MKYRRFTNKKRLKQKWQKHTWRKNRVNKTFKKRF